jgi:hypothetical protein
MNSVLDEVISEDITTGHVARRVEDWVVRLDKLYSLIGSWLPPGWRVDQTRHVEMDEEMMRGHRVGPRDVPVLDLKAEDGRSATLEPRGLWIIGTNGRVDLFAGSKHFLILDRAENFAPPDWRIENFFDRQQAGKLDKARLADALSP